MRNELAILLSIAIGASRVATTQDESPSRAATDFAAAVEARAAEDLRAWTAAHEGEAFGKTRSLAIALLAARSAGDAAGAEARREELAFVAGALEALEPAVELARGVLAWSAADFAAFDALRSEVEEARAAFERGDATAAWPRVERALAAGEPQDALALLNRALSEVAKLAVGLGHDPRTRDLVAALLASAEDSRDAPWAAWYAEWLAQIEWVAGRLEIATRHFERAIELRRTLGHADSECSLHCDLSLVRLALGDVEGGVGHAARAEELARATGDAALVRKAVQARVSSLYDLGEIEAALDLLARTEREGRARDAAQLRLDMLHAELLQDAGRLESARTWIERALELSEDDAVRAEAPNLRGGALLSAGLIYGDLGEHERGLATLDRALEFFTQAGEPSGAAWTRKDRGWILLDLGRAREAEAEFSAALAYAAANAEPPLEGLSALGCAESADRDAGAVDRSAEIDAWLATAERCGEELHHLELIERVASLRGSRLAVRGDERGALAQFEIAVETIERMRARFSLPDLLTHFLHDKVDPYRQAVFAAARLGDGARALHFAERSRARVLYEMRARPDIGGSDAAADPRVQAARHALAQAEALLRASRAPAEREERALRVEQAERALDAALLDVALASPRESRLHGAPPPRLEPAQMAERLRASPFDTLVEYVVGERESLAIVVRARDGAPRIDLATVPAGERELAALVGRLRAPIEALASGDLDLAHIGFDVAAARGLHAALIAPIAGTLGERVAIIPDGALWSAPFECFVTGGDAGRVDPERPFAHLRGLRFLLHERAIGYLPSMSLLAAASRPSGEPCVVAVLPPRGGPTSAEGEIAALRSALGARPEDLRVCDGTDLAAVEREAREARWLDVVAHGVFDARFPGNSHLVLGADGRLAAWQVERWQLGARLVVLSACHGGEGRVAAGEGALGLARSFLVAGADEVVASSWAVEDRATCDLMRSFWADVARGADPLDALRRAKLASIASDDPRGFARAHPYFWAGWISLRGQ